MPYPPFALPLDSSSMNDFKELSNRVLNNGDHERIVQINDGEEITTYTIYQNKRFVLAEVYEVKGRRRPLFYRVHAFRNGEVHPIIQLIEKAELNHHIGALNGESRIRGMSKSL